MKKIAVAINAKENFDPNIVKGLKGLDYIHVDVMDGKFVNNTNLNLDAFRILKENYEIPIIAHLMVINPLNYVEKIIKYVDTFLFHFEIEEDIQKLIDEVKKFKKKVGIVIKPPTNVLDIVPYLEIIDCVLVMSVNPGWSGQSFIYETIDKVKELAKYREKYSFFEILVDGGINLENSKKLNDADVLVSSSTILNAKKPALIIKRLKEID